jgi:hypothetical protein
MTRTLKGCLIGLTLIGLSSFASAEFYRYVDKEGKVLFTDNLANVPEDQRPAVDQFDDFYPESTPENETEATLPEGDLEQSEETDVKETAEALQEDLEVWAQRLNETGVKLRKEYESLMQRKEELDKPIDAGLSLPERKALAEEKRAFNKQIEDYEKRRQAFDEEAEAYNTRVGKEAQATKAEEE